MDNSANEALYIGAYIFIFVTALSLTIFLFTTMNSYADLSYRYGNTITSGSIIENIPIEKNRLISGKDVVSYYYNYIQRDMYGDAKNKIDYTLQISTSEKENSFLEANKYTYHWLITNIIPEAKYILKYNKVVNGQKYITIRKATDEEIDAKV